MRDQVQPHAHSAIPFLWICGPSGVGKSSVGWEVFTQVRAAGVTAAYLDTDQIGFCRPEPQDDPDHYVLRSRNVAALWPNFLAAGARAMIVSGILETPDGVRRFTAAVPGASVTIVRLRATPETLRERIWWRGRGGGPQIPGDQELHGATAARLQAVWEDSVATTEALERHRIGDICIDTDGRSVREVARAILAQAPGWSSLRGPSEE
jgi:predicted ABC-type ATPase